MKYVLRLMISAVAVLTNGDVSAGPQLTAELYVENMEIMAGEGVGGYIVIENGGDNEYLFDSALLTRHGDLGFVITRGDEVRRIGRDASIQMDVGRGRARRIPAGGSIKRPIYLLKHGDRFVFDGPGVYEVEGCVVLRTYGSMGVVGVRTPAVKVTVRERGEGYEAYRDAFAKVKQVVDVFAATPWRRIELTMEDKNEMYGDYAQAMRRFLGNQYNGFAVRRYFNSGGSYAVAKSAAWWSDVVSKGASFCDRGSIMLTVWEGMQEKVASGLVGAKRSEVVAGVPVL